MTKLEPPRRRPLPMIIHFGYSTFFAATCGVPPLLAFHVADLDYGWHRGVRPSIA